MKKQLFSSVFLLFLIIYCTPIFAGIVVASSDEGMVEISSPAQEPVEFSEIQVDVSALGTFLRADPSMEEGGVPVLEPTIIDLDAEGLGDWKWILINYSGEIFVAVGDLGYGERCVDDEIRVIGLFSATSELKSIDNLNRVPGAINCGEDYKTGETYFGNLPTDISEDFIIKFLIGSNIEIPSGAKFLFLCCADIYYPDNAGTIQVTIKKLELHQFLFSIENIVIILEVIFIILVVIFIKRESSLKDKSQILIRQTIRSCMHFFKKILHESAVTLLLRYTLSSGLIQLLSKKTLQYKIDLELLIKGANYSQD
jgi:hypothetical protein